MKILNLYACLGGNRYKWGNDHEITAVELDPVLAELYQERFPNDTVIVADAHQYLLEHFFKGKYLVENVIPYYEPLIPAQKRGRHLYWANFKLPNDLRERKITIMTGKSEVKKWCEFHDYDFTKYKGEQRIDKIARNLVDYEAGKTILDTVLGIYKAHNEKQIELFD